MGRPGSKRYTDAVAAPLNPYEAPAPIPSAELPADDDRVVAATYDVGPELVYRAVRFDMERRTWFRRIVFWLSFFTLALLFVGTVWRFPFWFALSAVGMFVILHGLQIVVPDLWTRRLLRLDQGRGQLLPQGHYRLELTTDEFGWTLAGRRRVWPVRELTDAYYLGDMLLICPEPGTLIPVPRTADFGPESFASFCRLLAIRLREESAA